MQSNTELEYFLQQFTSILEESESSSYDLLLCNDRSSVERKKYVTEILEEKSMILTILLTENIHYCQTRPNQT